MVNEFFEVYAQGRTHTMKSVKKARKPKKNQKKAMKWFYNDIKDKKRCMNIY